MLHVGSDTIIALEVEGPPKVAEGGHDVGIQRTFWTLKALRRPQMRILPFISLAPSLYNNDAG